MNRNVTWTNLGKDVTGCQKVEEVLEQSGLNYLVDKAELVFNPANPNLGVETVPNKVATYRTDTGKCMGVVGRDFQVIQNIDAFNFINSIHSDMEFVKAGESGNGACWIISQFPEMEVLGDKIRPHLIFQNGHNGYVGLKATICMLRIICQNQFNAAFKEASNSIHIRHCGDVAGKMKAAHEILSQMGNYLETYKSTAETLVRKKVDNVTLQQIISKMIADQSAVEEDSLKARRLDYFRQAYNADDNANFKGTAWGVMNAYTDYITHLPAGRVTASLEDKRFVKVSMENREVNQMLNLLEEVAC